MTDAALNVDPDFYTHKLLETDDSAEQHQRALLSAFIVENTSTPPDEKVAEAAPGSGAPIFVWSSGIRMQQARGSGGGGAAGGYSAPEFPDYVIRQHSLLGFYLSLNPGDEGVYLYVACACLGFGVEGGWRVGEDRTKSLTA